MRKISYLSLVVFACLLLNAGAAKTETTSDSIKTSFTFESVKEYCNTHNNILEPMALGQLGPMLLREADANEMYTDDNAAPPSILGAKKLHLRLLSNVGIELVINQEDISINGKLILSESVYAGKITADRYIAVIKKYTQYKDNVEYSQIVFIVDPKNETWTRVYVSQLPILKVVATEDGGVIISHESDDDIVMPFMQYYSKISTVGEESIDRVNIAMFQKFVSPKN